MLILSLLVAAALWAEPTGPAAKAPAAQPTLTYAPPKAADAKDNQLVCKSEPVLGSRMPVRRCHTVAEIKDRQQQDREAIEHAQILQEPSR